MNLRPPRKQHLCRKTLTLEAPRKMDPKQHSEGQCLDLSQFLMESSLSVMSYPRSCVVYIKISEDTARQSEEQHTIGSSDLGFHWTQSHGMNHYM